MSVADRVPVPPGLKITVKVLLPPAAIVATPRGLTVKSVASVPLTYRSEILRVLVPWFTIVNATGEPLKGRLTVPKSWVVTVLPPV